MNDFDFHTLNSQDFELLVRDLLNAREDDRKSGVFYQSFPAGRDKGIDLLDNKSGPYSNRTVVQVKHFHKTPLEGLLNTLFKSSPQKKCEKDKLTLLNPMAYILVTSQELTLENRKKIMVELSPYVRSLPDIIDRTELNRLLGLYPVIVENHYKLWFSSRTVFDRILHNDIHGRSMQLEDDIAKKIQLFVMTPSVLQAEKILLAQKFVVITGEPGSGKTTLAEMLLNRLAGKDYKMYWIDKSVSEIDALLKEDDSRQVFYFDDFLGHTRLEMEEAKVGEKGLLFFLRRIRKYENKFFVLTTRTQILNQAELESERFKKANIREGNFNVQLDQLSDAEKIQMIFNHLAVYEVPQEYREALYSDEGIAKIIRHSNFSPRLVEFVCINKNYARVEPTGYLDYVLQQLRQPHEIWRYAYEEQLDDIDRFVLQTLFCFNRVVPENILVQAFEKRFEYEIEVNRIARVNNAFYRSLQKLMDSFIENKVFTAGDGLGFINPSLEDFLFAYLMNNNPEKTRMSDSFLFVEQIIGRFRAVGKRLLTLYPSQYFFERLQKGDFTTTVTHTPQPVYTNVYGALVTWMFFKDQKGVELACSYLQKVNWKQIGGLSFMHVFDFIQVAYQTQAFREIIAPNLDTIALFLFRKNGEISNIYRIIDLYKQYHRGFKTFINNGRNREQVKSAIDNLYSDEISQAIDDLTDNATYEDLVYEKRDEIANDIKVLYHACDIYDEPELDEFDDVNWQAITIDNQYREQMAKDD